MTNEEAKEILAIYRFNLIQSISNQLEGDIEALDMAIQALEQQPSEDCISREEAIRVAEQGQIQGYEWQFKKLCNLPSVTPQPKTDFEELKRKILMEVDGGTDDNWLRYGDVCDRISNSIDEYKAESEVDK